MEIGKDSIGIYQFQFTQNIQKRSNTRILITQEHSFDFTKYENFKRPNRTLTTKAQLLKTYKKACKTLNNKSQQKKHRRKTSWSIKYPWAL